MTALVMLRAVRASVAVFVRDVVSGLIQVSHSTLALLGLTVVAVLAFAGSHPELRHEAERAAFGWLQSRYEARAEREGNLLVSLADPQGVARATATDPKELDRQQAAVAKWLSRRYRVAPEPVSRLVQEAWQVGRQAGLEPTLILAIMAVESSFNPFAQSAVGAQGLMQVMTRVHDDKYERFGGTLAAFDPVTNLRVGVQVLKECIQRAGGLEAGLRYYVGAANLEDDGGYAGKVLAEQAYLRQVASGRGVPFNAPMPVVAPVRSAPVAAAEQAATAPAGDAVIAVR
ncbi:lytic transglycosylase domain-containing protein [Azohydromonas aeria]|uniref:lytic transglycosylase domain-containing protein n=1 Tax=Azohydromonas aeria TaxID=2590212 RepID=UPI0012FA50DE|nr:lytic transglycosylase domain-containing protein [Azohydromonas aeria]